MKKVEESPYTFTEVKTLIAHCLYDLSDVEPDEIACSCSLLKDFGMNSWELSEFLIWCEKTFGLIITSEEELDISTVGDLLNTIKNKKKWRED